MKLGIYMGSFNPPHLGHERVINYLLENNIIDKVLVIPTLNYWHKNDLVDIKHRINMLKYLENENIIIDNKHNKYIYTLELLHELEKKYPKESLYPIIGADNLISFDKWKNYQELLDYPFIVMNRDNLDVDKYLKKYPNNHFIIINNFVNLMISSSKLRENLDKDYLNPKVLKYIQKNHLYQK